MENSILHCGMIKYVVFKTKLNHYFKIDIHEKNVCLYEIPKYDMRQMSHYPYPY